MSDLRTLHIQLDRLDKVNTSSKNKTDACHLRILLEPVKLLEYSLDYYSEAGSPGDLT